MSYLYLYLKPVNGNFTFPDIKTIHFDTILWIKLDIACQLMNEEEISYDYDYVNYYCYCHCDHTRHGFQYSEHVRNGLLRHIGFDPQSALCYVPLL